MDIRIKNDNHSAVVALSGRLDTVSAPVLESRIKDLIDDVEELIFDFCDLDYISSSGLRILLFTQKKMISKKMIVRNVRKEIMDIFEISGFAEILRIEQNWSE